MGDFLTAETLKTKTRVPTLCDAEPDDIEFIYIDVAERAIEEALNLDLNTDRQPRHWAGRMDATPRIEDEFKEDYEKATFYTVERMASNPGDLRTQTIQGASVQYQTELVPMGAKVIMRRWGQPLRIGRA